MKHRRGSEKFAQNNQSPTSLFPSGARLTQCVGPLRPSHNINTMPITSHTKTMNGAATTGGAGSGTIDIYITYNIATVEKRGNTRCNSQLNSARRSVR